MTLLMQSFLSLLLISSTYSGDRNNTYHVNSSSNLEQYLCNTTWSSQYLVFLLNSSVNFTISSGNFCQVTHKINKIEIRSNSPTKSAIITCAHNDTPGVIPLPRRGLFFFNTTVFLKQLELKNCGTYLTTIQDDTIIDYLNSSSLYYTSFHAGALVFVHCQINMTEVNIYSSYGFSMIGINLYNSTIDTVSMSNSSYSFEVYQLINQSIGSGFLLHFMDTNNSIAIYDILIKNAFFSYNWDYNTHSCITNTYYNKHSSMSGNYYPIVNAAGLTILYTQQNSGQVSVHIAESYFVQNYGSFAGGMFILQYNTIAVTNTTITNTVFSHNILVEDCHGAAIVFYWYSLHISTNQERFTRLHLFNTSFLKHQGISQWPVSSLDNGAVYIGIVNPGFVQLQIIFSCCTFLGNFVANTGACLYATVYQFADNTGNVSITLDSTIALRNSQYTDLLYLSSASIFYFHKINRVDITGTSNFSNNYGSVISSKNSNVYLSGNLIFSENHAMTGPAVRLVGDCQLYFMNGVIAKFTENWAQLVGGAIYADTAESNDECVIQIDTDVSQIVFTNNEARRAGSSLYAKPIYSCYNNLKYLKPSTETIAYYEKYFNFTNTKLNTTLLQLSTIPQGFSEGAGIQIPRKVYPGQEIYYCISAIDAIGRKVYSNIAIDIVRNNSQTNIPKTTKVWLSFDDQEQLIEEGIKCTVISVTVHTNEKVNIIDAMIVFSQNSQTEIKTESLKVHLCPLGFDLNVTAGVCTLSQSFKNLQKHGGISVTIKANLSSQLITRPSITNNWAGKIENINGDFGVSPACPLGYCDSNQTLLHFYSGDLSSNESFKLSDGITDYHPPLCLHQREGTLCGRCSEGLSVVFGSTKCQHCSNAWIASISIYLVAGPFFIYLLFVLRLTLTTGTLNGIIFYVQAANCGLIDGLRLHYYNSNSSIEKLSSLVIYLLNILNLEPGIPLCFYNGMTELSKTGLNFALPLYYLTIVVVLIILCHFSPRLSNRIAHSSVQVLVTPFFFKLTYSINQCNDLC